MGIPLRRYKEPNGSLPSDWDFCGKVSDGLEVPDDMRIVSADVLRRTREFWIGHLTSVQIVVQCGTPRQMRRHCSLKIGTVCLCGKQSLSAWIELTEA